MAEKKVKFTKKLKNFIKKNSYALIVAGCALTLAIALGVTAVTSANFKRKEGYVENPPIENIIPSGGAQASNTTPVVFNYPVKDYTLGNTYTDSSLVYNETLNEYTTHLGIDFIVGEGADVMASYAGTIESISYDTMTGTKIVIDHGNGLKSSYMSLSSEVNVVEGQSVGAGEVIGKASSSASGEQKLGSHLHFEVTLDGTPVNPMTYLGEK